MCSCVHVHDVYSSHPHYRIPNHHVFLMQRVSRDVFTVEATEEDRLQCRSGWLDHALRSQILEVIFIHAFKHQREFRHFNKNLHCFKVDSSVHSSLRHIRLLDGFLQTEPVFRDGWWK